MFKFLLRLIISPLLIVSLLAAAQPMHTVGSKVTADTIQINSLITKVMRLGDTSTTSLLPIIKQLQQLSTKLDNKRGLAYADFFECRAYWMAANFPMAMQTGLQALAGAEKYHIKELVPSVYSIMANLHKETGNYKMAFNDNLKGLNAAKANLDTVEIIGFLSQEAMFVHSFYSDKHQPQKDNSLQLKLDALKMAESSPKYEKQRIAIYDNLAQEYKERRDYPQALFYGNKGVEMAKKYNRPRSLTYAYCWLGESYYYMGQHDKGIAYLHDAITISQQLKQPYRQMELNRAMYQCYKSSGDYKPAVSSLERYMAMHDSIQVAKSEKQISELQIKYETAKKDRQIESLNELNKLKSRKILWVMIGLPVFVLLLVIILYQNIVINTNSRLIKIKNDMLHEALDKIAYVQSHQIRKPLASIMGLMNLIKGDNYKADKEILQKMETATLDLDQNIRDVIAHTEIRPLTEAEQQAAKW